MWNLIEPYLSFLNVDKVRRDSFPCILNYKIISLLFIMYSGLITSRVIFGEPIVCYGSEIPNDSVSSSFCYMTGTYTINNDLKREHSDTYTGDNWEMNNQERRYHEYYQYIPIILVLMSIGNYIPRVIWLYGENNVFSDIIQDLQSHIINEDKKAAQLANLALFIQHRRGEHKKLFMWHIISQALYIVNILSQAYHLNLVFSGEFYYYGISKNMHDMFPKVSHCDMNHYGISGNVDTNPIRCFLPMNSLNDKFFLLTWYLMIVSLSLLLLNMLYTIIYILFPPFRNFVLKKKVGKKVDHKDVLKVMSGLDYYGKVSESFFIGIICQNLTNEIVSELFSMI